MAVPSSGSLSLRSIAKEVAANTYAFHPVDGTGLSQLGSTSLKDMSTGGGTNSTGSLLSSGSFPAINTANSASDRPDGSTPHSMSEFYNYNQDEVTYVGLNTYSTSVPKPVFACGATTDTTWYFPDTTPAVNDQVYTNSGLSSTPSAGNYGYAAIGTTTGFRFTVNSSGVITVVASC